MKKKSLLVLALLALALVMGLALVSCDNGTTGGGGTNPGGGGSPIDGNWLDVDGDFGYRISGSSATMTIINESLLDAVTLDAVRKGYYYVGVQYLRNLTQTGNSTWSGQVLIILFSGSTAAGTDWRNVTLTLSANGRSLAVSVPSLGTLTWNKQ